MGSEGLPEGTGVGSRRPCTWDRTGFPEGPLDVEPETHQLPIKCPRARASSFMPRASMGVRAWPAGESTFHPHHPSTPLPTPSENVGGAKKGTVLSGPRPDAAHGTTKPILLPPRCSVPTTDTHSRSTPRARTTFCLTPMGQCSPSPRRDLRTLFKPLPSILRNAAHGPLTGGSLQLEDHAPAPCQPLGAAPMGTPASSSSTTEGPGLWTSGGQRGDEAAQRGTELCPGRSARPRGSAHRGPRGLGRRRLTVIVSAH